MIVCRNGVTRIVFLVGAWAIKLPRFGYGWTMGLRGLLCNIQERVFATTGAQQLCPVLWCCPGGWMLVMRRARPLSDREWREFNADAFGEDLDWAIPVENKPDSFGVLDGKIVAVDYGS